MRIVKQEKEKERMDGNNNIESTVLNSLSTTVTQKCSIEISSTFSNSEDEVPDLIYLRLPIFDNYKKAVVVRSFIIGSAAEFTKIRL